MKRLLILASLATLAASAGAVNLISDGGFELGDVASPQFTGTPWTTQYSYATSNTNGGVDSIWSEGYMRVMDGGKTANNGTTGHGLWDSVTRSEGESFLAVNGSTNTSNIPFVLEQVFSYSGTGLLEVSFDSVNLYRQDVNGASSLSVYLDGTYLGSTSTQLDNTWRTATFSGSVANTGSHTLRIQADTTQASGNDFGLDDIQVTASPVPEPFTMGLAGVALLAAARRRLRKSA
ncbi:MAG: PEP-CTERM sorting domain-containing protein [Fimbriimonadaceae bacterium]|nr:PEP-CTERM sorting domain-containing protein [Fimbriimonadaceae bacterium]